MPIYRLSSSFVEPFPVEVKGESFRKENLEKIAGIYDETEGYFADDHLAALFLEDNNPNDPGNAVAVKIDNMQVGYLAKSAARKYRRRIAQLNLAGPVISICNASIRGGRLMDDGEISDFGVRLDFDLDEFEATKVDPKAVRAKPAAPARPVAVPAQENAPLFAQPVAAQLAQVRGAAQAKAKTKKKFRWNIITIGAVLLALCICVAFIQAGLQIAGIIPTDTPKPVDVMDAARKTMQANEALYTPTFTLQATAIDIPTETEVILPTNTAEPTIEIASTERFIPLPSDTPRIIFTLAPLPTSTRSLAGPCTCKPPDLNCDDFGSQREAQACFDYCRSQGYGDVYKLDRDKDGRVCES